MGEKPQFSGPIIDRDVLGPGLPETYASDVPYFDVQRDNDSRLHPNRWRYWFNERRGGWLLERLLP